MRRRAALAALLLILAVALLGNSYLSTRYNVFGPALPQFTWGAATTGAGTVGSAAVAGTTMAMLDSRGKSHWANEVYFMVTGDTLYAHYIARKGLRVDSLIVYPIEANGPTYRFPGSIDSLGFTRPWSQSDSTQVTVTWNWVAER